MTDERQALDDLTKSEGWAFLIARVKAEWGAKAYAIQLERAAGSPDAPHEIIRLSFANRVVHSLFGWPDDRIRDLTKQTEQAAQPESMSRGGAR